MSRLVRIQDTSRGTPSRAAERRHPSNLARIFVRHALTLCGRTSTCVSESTTDGCRVSPVVALFSALSCLCPNTRRSWVVGVIQEFCPCLHATRRVVGAAVFVSSTLASPLLCLIVSAPSSRARTRRVLHHVLCPVRLSLPPVTLSSAPVMWLTSTGRRVGGPTTSAPTVVAVSIECRCLGGGF